MKTLFLVAAVLLLGGFEAGAASATANLKDGVILEGYDPVSYFKAKKPIKGSAQFKTEVDGVTYYFANSANRDEFTKNPKAFTPAYEGWCATAVAGGKKYAIDPLNYEVSDGRLFLFYKGWLGDAKKDWDKDEPGQLKKADANWPTVRNTKE